MSYDSLKTIGRRHNWQIQYTHRSANCSMKRKVSNASETSKSKQCFSFSPFFFVFISSSPSLMLKTWKPKLLQWISCWARDGAAQHSTAQYVCFFQEREKKVLQLNAENSTCGEFDDSRKMLSTEVGTKYVFDQTLLLLLLLLTICARVFYYLLDYYGVCRLVATFFLSVAPHSLRASFYGQAHINGLRKYLVFIGRTFARRLGQFVEHSSRKGKMDTSVPFGNSNYERK